MADDNYTKLKAEGLIYKEELSAETVEQINKNLSAEDVEELIRIRRKLGDLDTLEDQRIF